ncbi:MAG: hypothetical protein IKL84_08925 [Clostridia bacterium]|nr:hypothetical protein [Clostridia bacterium]
MRFKKIIRFISILLALVMLIGTFTACAGETPGVQDKPDETDEEISVTTSPDSTEPPETTTNSETNTNDEDTDMINAKNAYLQYIAGNTGTDSEYMVYETDGSFVALKSGEPMGVYASPELALKAMLGEDADTTKLIAADNDKLFVYREIKLSLFFWQTCI